jgi:uncharacterized repeat protein (TIGR01451 family)
MHLASHQKFKSRAFKTGIWTCLLMILPQFSWAVGTISGTAISNSATLTYSIGVGPTSTSSSNTVSFTVDDKVNVLVAGGVITNGSAAQTRAATPFTVTNNGNATQGYSLVAGNALNGAYTVNATAITDTFDPATALRICLDDGTGGGTADDGILQAGELAACPAAPGVTQILSLAPNATAHLLVVTDIPASGPGSNNGDAAVVSLHASTLWPNPNGAYATEEPAGAVAGNPVNPGTYPPAANTAGVDVVFADSAGVVAGDIASDGAHSTYGAFSISGVNVVLTKTITSVVDPSGGPVVMPGAVMTYQIAVAVSGSGTATSLVITDPLPTENTYVASSIVVDGASQTDPVDPPADNTDFGVTTANAVTVNLGNVAAPANHVITFRATIN